MKEQIEKRLIELKDEFSKGEQQFNKYCLKIDEVKRLMLKLNGAIQVLEEELAKQVDKNNVS